MGYWCVFVKCSQPLPPFLGCWPRCLLGTGGVCRLCLVRFVGVRVVLMNFFHPPTEGFVGVLFDADPFCCCSSS